MVYLRLNDRSRMRREFQVRFCESLWGRFLWATRRCLLTYTLYLIGSCPQIIQSRAHSNKNRGSLSAGSVKPTEQSQATGFIDSAQVVLQCRTSDLLRDKFVKISARIEGSLEQELLELVKQSKQSVTDVIKKSIHHYHESCRREKASKNNLLINSNFIGCATGDANLSQHYKSELTKSLEAK